MTITEQLQNVGITLIYWNDSDFPTDGRTVLLFKDGSINFARYEPECGQTLKIVSALGATRLGNFLVGCKWAELPAPQTITITVE